MPLDPQLKTILDQMAALGAPPMYTLSPEEARRQMEAARPATTGEPVARVEDRTVPGAAGEIPIRVYTPAGEGPFPALVFFHGGGWVVGGIAGSDVTCRALTNAAGCVVISVDYRLAPEHKFPAAADDAYATTQWVAEHAVAIGVDPGRIAVGGTSAGGNLAAVVALMARDRGRPTLAFQLLVVPVTDHNFDTLSYRENGEGQQLPREAMVWFWNHYLPSTTDGHHPYASPLRAESLRGLPPALVITAEYDPLRDEGKMYTERLREAGVPVTYRCYDGMTHGFFSMAALLDRAKPAVAEAAAALRAAFATPAVPTGD